MDMSEPTEFHFEFGQNLKTLRDQGVLIISSGNIVHNIKEIIWDNPHAEPYLWATEFDEQVKKCIIQRDFIALIGDLLFTPAGRLSVPTADHYYPLLYALGAADDNDTLRFEYEEVQNGSISMRTLSLGLL
jgi:4,5-DOPA dioxygenase extradiol